MRYYGILVLCVLAAATVGMAQGAKDTVGYLAGAKGVRLTWVTTLSDGTVLIAGAADGLGWLPAETPRVELVAEGINNAEGAGKGKDTAAQRIGFMLHTTGDLRTVLQVVSLPAGAAEDIRRIRTDALPGAPTGSLYISGTTRDSKPRNGGYFLAKLDTNFVKGVPSRLDWVRNVYAQGEHANVWDVGGDGKVVYVVGEPFNFNWCTVQRLKADGTDDIVPNWRYHRMADGTERAGALADAKDVVYSAIFQKTMGRVDLRSWTQAEYDAVTPDGNGGTRKGSWPMDAFFKGPGDPKDFAKNPGPGYTGLSTTRAFTQRVGGIAVDRRTNHMYIGFTVHCRPAVGETDYEPCVIAFTETGEKKWWSRLHTEGKENSPAQQFVEAVAVDYSRPPRDAAVVVAARSVGGGPNGLWSGDSIAKERNADNPGHGFKDSFTGTDTKVQVGWLGKLRASDGTLLYASYVAEWADDMKGVGPASRDRQLDGWPDPNGGFAQLANTGVREDMRVDIVGRVFVLGYGRRTLTTRNAYQRMLKRPADPIAPRANEGVSAWNEFARVYRTRLDGLDYSSVLTGVWDPISGEGAANTVLTSLCPVRDGVLVIGYHKPGKDGVALGNPIPTANVPPWATDKPEGETAFVARLGVR